MSISDIDRNLFNNILKQIGGSFAEGDDYELLPSVLIRGAGFIWCYQPTKRMFVKISRGTDAYIVDDLVDDMGRVMVYTSFGDCVMIDKEELIFTGYE